MLLVGTGSAVTLRLAVTRALGSSWDLTLVTSAVIHTRWPKLTQVPSEAPVDVDWTPTVQIESESFLYLFYTFASDGSDLPRAGNYGLAIDLTTPLGVIPCPEVSLPVEARHP